MDDLLQVRVHVGRIGHTSLRLNFEVRKKNEAGEIEEDLMATAHFVLVATDRENLKPLPVPEALRVALDPFVEHAR
jgi:acyl-CoA thioesterase FadM